MMSKKQSASRYSKPNNEVINTYVDERGIKITVYKAQHPRLEEFTFPRKKEYNDIFIEDRNEY